MARWLSGIPGVEQALGVLRHLVPSWHRLLLWGLLFGIALSINVLTPAWGDDWWRVEKPADWAKILTRITDEYRGWTGRFVTLAVTHLFMLEQPLRDPLFQTVNASFWLLAAAVIARAALGRPLRPDGFDTGVLGMAFALLWLLPQAFGEAAVWRTGAMGYLWPMVGAVAVFQRFTDSLKPSSRLVQASHLDVRTAWPWAVVAFLCANALENLGASFTLLTAWLLWRARQRVGKGQGIIVVAALLGILSNVVAPGNMKRYTAQDDGLPMWVRLPKLLDRIWQAEWQETRVVPLLLVLLLLAAALRLRWRRPDLAVWMAFAVLLAVSMIGATAIAYGNRTAFSAEFVLCIVVLGVLAELLQAPVVRDSALGWVPLVWLGVATVFGASLLTTFTQTRSIAAQHDRRLELIAAYRNAGVDRVLLPSIRVPYYTSVREDIAAGPLFLRDIHEDTKDNTWRNGTYGRYHGIKFATRVPQAALIFLPELEHEQTLIQLAAAEPRSLWLGRLALEPAVYLLAPGGICAPLRLRFNSDEHTDVTWSTQNQVAVVDEQGREVTKQYCAFVVPVPKGATTVELWRGNQPTGLSAALDQ